MANRRITARARFLGWREDDAPCISRPAHVIKRASPRFVVGPSDSLTKLPGDGVDSPRQRAIWSDDDSIGVTNGFDLAKWKAECAANIKSSRTPGRHDRVLRPGIQASSEMVQLPSTPTNEDQMVSALQVAAKSCSRVSSGNSDWSQLGPHPRRVPRSEGEAQAGEMRQHREPGEAAKASSAVPVSPSQPVVLDIKSRDQRLTRIPESMKLSEHQAAEQAMELETSSCSSPKPPGAGSARAKLRRHVFATCDKQRRIGRHAEIRRKRFEDEFSTVDLKAVREIFELYSQGCDMVRPEDILPCLMELGLRGRGRDERRGVSRVVKEVAVDVAFKSGLESLDPDGFHSVEKGLAGKDVGHDPDLGYQAQPINITSRKAPGIFDIETFGLDIIPAARSCLRDIKESDLLEIFIKATGTSDKISETECRNLMDNLGLDTDIARENLAEAMLTIAKTDDASPTSDASNSPRSKRPGRNRNNAKRRTSSTTRHIESIIDFDTFVAIVARTQEKMERHLRQEERNVKLEFSLPASTFWQYRRELVKVSKMFTLLDTDEVGRLNSMQVQHLLRQLGLRPHCPREALVIKRMLRSSDTGADTVSLAEFLNIMDLIRLHQRGARGDSLQRVFMKHDRDNSGRLDFQELETVLKETGLFQTTGFIDQKQQMEVIRSLIHEFDTDGSGDIDFEEFQELCQQIVEKLFVNESDKSESFALSIGFSREQLSELRLTFDRLDKDSSGALTLAEVWQVLKRFGTVKNEELQQLFKTYDTDRDGELVFTEFLSLMKLVSTSQLAKQGAFGGSPFRVVDVSLVQIGKMLRLFNVTAQYIATLNGAEQVDILCDYLGVNPQSDLKQDLPQPVGDAQRLLEYARKKARGMPNTTLTSAPTLF